MKRSYIYAVFVVGVVLIAASMLVLSGAIVAQEGTEPSPVGEPPVFLSDFYEAWVHSPHARFEDEAFIHWDEDEEGVIPEHCARCHSTPGYQDYLGVDGSEVGVVNAPAPLGTVINCDACHNSATVELTSVTFPSGVEITDLGDSSRCMVCHQGRSSANSVNLAIEEAGLVDQPNTVSEDLRFINIHYYAAAASLLGSEVHGGYEFDGNLYHMRNEHVEGYDTCQSCHDPHTLEIQVAECADCHDDVSDVEDLMNIRSVGSVVDYDGDGDLEEGIAGEIETLQEMAYAAIQMYANEVTGTPIVYEPHSYPYFFIDTNGDGEAGEDEAIFPNAYNSFTPALLQAVYNYQVTQKDPGGYAHNPDYHIQLLYDTIANLNEQTGGEGIDLSTANRDNFGHFRSTAEAFRHWDEDGEVSARCSKCHTAEGLPFFIEHGTTIRFEPSSSQSCTTCHNSLETFTVYPVASVVMPSGAEVGFGDEDDPSPNNICLHCHQGRQSTVSVNSAISRSGAGNDEVSEDLGFQNVHYFAAGATLFGNEAMGAYQFEGKDYNGEVEHTRRFDECSDCHDQHSAMIRYEECMDCHEEVEGPEDIVLIRAHPEDKDRVDYDGDGDMDEPIHAEIETMHNDLYGLILDYAATTLEVPIVYDSHSYPYWFIDTDGDGAVSEGEAAYPNKYATWTPALLRAAYNYQYVAKDPGAFAHNPDYVLQILYDSVEAMGGEEAVAPYTRPEVRD